MMNGNEASKGQMDHSKAAFSLLPGAVQSSVGQHWQEGGCRNPCEEG